ncbi:MAG: oxygenase MpaB family protein [Pseudomonadota bacterium]
MITAQQLDHMTHVADPPLDDLIERWAADENGVETVAALFKEIHTSERLSHQIIDQLLTNKLINTDIAEFFLTRSVLPDLPWIQKEEIVTGGEFFRERGLMAFVGLAFASLPACYCWDTEARVLTTTGRLSQPGRIPRRIPETAQFVLDIGTKDAFEPDGVGIQAAHKIRLMHSCIRYLLINDPAAVSVNPNKRYLKPWDVERFGPPISQAYLAATLLTFHQVILHSLKKLSLRVSPAQQAAYIHRWNVTGWFLGIEESTLGQLTTMQDTQALHALVMHRWRHKTVSAQDLSATLIEYVRTNVIEGALGGLWNPLVVVPPVLTRYLSGKDTSKALNLKLNVFQKLAYFPVVFFTRVVGFLDNFRLFRRMTVALTRYATRHLWGFVKEKQKQSPDPDGRARGVIVPAEFESEWRLEFKAES